MSSCIRIARFSALPSARLSVKSPYGASSSLRLVRPYHPSVRSDLILAPPTARREREGAGRVWEKERKVRATNSVARERAALGWEGERGGR